MHFYLDQNVVTYIFFFKNQNTSCINMNNCLPVKWFRFNYCICSVEWHRCGLSYLRQENGQETYFCLSVDSVLQGFLKSHLEKVLYGRNA
ncbi:hypothetical protein FKM82_001244 [Ascaphus truei]